MGQWRVGTCTVTNGSATVTIAGGSSGADAVQPGDSFKVDRDGEAIYTIASRTPATGPSITSLTLSVPYAGVTGAGLGFMVTTDFTPNRSYPELAQGDADAADWVTAALRKIDADVGALLGTGSPPSYTPGGVFFKGASGVGLAQDAANLFWDNANKRLGIRTNTPAAPVHARGTGLFQDDTPLILQNTVGTEAGRLIAASAPSLIYRPGTSGDHIFQSSGGTELLRIQGSSGGLTVASAGPHAIGTGLDSRIRFVLGGGFTGSSYAYAERLIGTITAANADAGGLLIDSALTIAPAPGNPGYGIYVGPAMQRAASGTHSEFVSAFFAPPTLLTGAATVTNAATVKVSNAPTGATNTYALWVAGGLSRFEGDIHLVNQALGFSNSAGTRINVFERVPGTDDLRWNLLPSQAEGVRVYATGELRLFRTGNTAFSIGPSPTEGRFQIRLVAAGADPGGGTYYDTVFSSPNSGSGQDALTLKNANGSVVIGSDPGGSELLRVGGAGRFAHPIVVDRTIGVDGRRIGLIGSSLQLGEIGAGYTGTDLARVWLGSNLNSTSLTPTQANTANPSWLIRFDTASDTFQVIRIPPGGSQTALLDVQATGNVFFSGTASAANPTASTHLTTKSYVDGLAVGIYGSRGLRGQNNSTSPTTKYDLSADFIVLRNANRNLIVRANVSVTCDVTVAGPTPNGRDQAAAFPANSWIHVYVIDNGTTTASLASLNEPLTGPALPSGYTHWAYAGAIRFNGSSQLVNTRLRGSWAYYYDMPIVLTGGSATTETAVSVAHFVPPNALAYTANFKLFITSNGSGAYVVETTIRHTSGMNYDLITLIGTGGANVGFATRREMTLPNINQQVYYLHSVTSGSGQALDIAIDRYQLPNGGE